MPRGRPKKKPNVDTAKEVETMVKEACKRMKEPFDDRIPRSADLPSMNSVAEEMCLTIIKLKRLLITGNYYSSTTSRAVQERVANGMPMDQICSELNIRPASFYANIPYSKGAYNLEEPSLFADQSVRYRERKRALADLHESISSGTVDEQKASLWKSVCAFQDYPFTTSGRGSKPGVKFRYEVSKTGGNSGRHYGGEAVPGFGNELWIVIDGQRKEKSISRSTVDRAFAIAREMEGRVPGPKALNVPGAHSYLFAIFTRFGVITSTPADASTPPPSTPASPATDTDES